MKAGLLICDHVSTKYLDEFGDYPQMFQSLFPDLDWKHYDCVRGEYPDDLSECDVYFATGSRHSVYEDFDWIRKLKALIRDLYKKEKKFIGFCFGHQLIGESLGGKVEKSRNGWCIGVHQFNITSKLSWMQPLKEQIGLLMMCQDQITSLPADSKVLAGSVNCPNGIIKVGDTFLGIQGHPEFSKAYEMVLMTDRKELIGEILVNEGVDSLGLKVDTDLIVSWIRNFLKA